MKVLVATKETQGRRRNDFSWTDEGEFVCFPFECDGEQIDGTCGCKRSFSGFSTHKSTTTAKVVEKGITEEQFVELYRHSQTAAGWVKYGDLDPTVAREAAELLRIADTFPVGTVVEKRGDGVQSRRAA